MIESDDDDDESDDELTGRQFWVLKKKPEKPKIAAPVPAQAPTVSVQKEKIKKKVEEVKIKYGVDSVEELDKKVMEIFATRGRKNTDIKRTLHHLEMLTKASRIYGPRKEIPLLMHLISAMFDANKMIDEYMELDQWRTCYRALVRCVKLLNHNETLVLGVWTGDEIATGVLKSKVNPESSAQSNNDDNVIKVIGSLESFILRLEDEYMKSLRQLNPHTRVSDSES